MTPTLRPDQIEIPAGMDRAEALAYVSRLYDHAAAGLLIWTDAELIARFLGQCSRTGSSETRCGYERDLGHFIAWRDNTFPQLLLRQITAAHAESYVSLQRELVAAGAIKPRTFNRRIATISSLYRWGSEPGRSISSGIHQSPIPRRAMLTEPKSGKALTDAELNTVLEMVREAALGGSRTAARDLVLIQGAYLTGVRVGELRTLRWGDVECLEVGGQITVLGKGKKLRTIRISPDTLALFESLGRGPAESWLFPSNRNDGPMSRQGVGSRFRQWGKQAGFRLHPHRCRHSHATAAIRSGCDVFTLARTLGHESISDTAIYVTQNPNDSSSLKLG